MSELHFCYEFVFVLFFENVFIISRYKELGSFGLVAKTRTSIMLLFDFCGWWVGGYFCLNFLSFKIFTAHYLMIHQIHQYISDNAELLQ